MPNSDKHRSYSQVLSAATWICFSFSAAGQISPLPPETPPRAEASPADANAIKPQQQSIALQQQSVERQRVAVSQQAAAARVTNSPSPAPLKSHPQASDTAPNPFSPGCAAVSPMILQGVIQRAASTYAVSPTLISAVIHQESAGYPCAVSEKGAMGLMQLMPDTATQMGVREPFDVIQNVEAGTRLLAELMRRYKGDLNRVLAAYNAGSAAVDRSTGPPPFQETQNYIRSVLDHIKTPFDPKLISLPVR